MRSIFTIIAVFVLFSVGAQEMEVITLTNPSFEGNPRRGVDIFYLEGWRDCGAIYFGNETPPDIHPDNMAWQNSAPPEDGNTYLGMVVRDNDSWESVTQRLSTAIQGGQCYSFSVSMMRSSRYVSPTRLNIDKIENYQEPAVLRIWGGSGFCNQRELLAESTPVDNQEWKTFSFEFRPTQNHRYFTIEAFYKTPILFPYNGHILVDNASEIVRIACPGEELAVVEEPIKPEVEVVPPHKRRKKPQVNTPPPPENTVPPKKEGPKIMEDLDRKKIKKGQTFTIKNLYFEADQSDINSRSHDVLNEIFYFLAENKDIVIEIGGHTNGLCESQFCDKLSTDRAKTVAQYLNSRGIEAARLQFKGYGKRNQIASNNTALGRQKNQRVEIKILELES
jgi:outer membrane protein OmpA-like peptidoglycan-associated protein